MVKKRIDEDKSHSRDGPGSSILRISDFPLSEEIISHRFSKKFAIPIFDYYTEATDPVQHLWAYQVKMAVHSHNDYLMCRVFPSSLKGVTLDWFYSRHDLSESSRKLATLSSTSTPRGKSLRRTATTYSSSRWSQERPSNAISVISKTKWPWFITVSTMLLRLHSLPDCRWPFLL